MVDAVVSLPTLVVALVVFGLAPGLLLRIIIRAFPRGDPRRDELLAELYAVPRLERPFWVVEQVEVAFAEGVWPRLVSAAAGRIVYRWRLESGTEAHARHPNTFWIPSEDEKAAVTPGTLVKLMFHVRKLGGERMWVEVTGVEGRRWRGRLVNDPFFIPRLRPGDEVKFTPDEIIDITETPPPGESAEGAPEALCPCCWRTRSEPEV